MPHQTLSTTNDYEQKINYDWPYNVSNTVIYSVINILWLFLSIKRLKISALLCLH